MERLRDDVMLQKATEDPDNFNPSFSPDIKRSQESLFKVFGVLVEGKSIDKKDNQNQQINFEDIMQKYMKKNKISSNQNSRKDLERCVIKSGSQNKLQT